MSLRDFVKRLFASEPLVPSFAHNSDDELRKLWRDRFTLTKEARAILKEERERRANSTGMAEPAPEHEANELDRSIELVVTTNLNDFNVATLDRGWFIVLSPIWEPGTDGLAIRRGALITRSKREDYYEGAGRSVLESPHIGQIVRALAKRKDPDLPLIQLRQLWCDEEAPYAELADTWSETLGSVSLLLADAARRFRAGITIAELCDPASPQTQGLERVLELEDEFMSSFSAAPVEELVRLTQEARFTRRRVRPS